MTNKTTSYDLGKIPPQAPEMEEAVLGALMLEKDSIDKISIKPEYFYKDAHQTIFRAIQKLSSTNNPIDLLTVTEQLKIDGKLEEVGGPYAISVLTSKVSTAANIEYHSLIVTDKFIKRELIRIGSEMQEKAYDSSIDTFDIVDSAYQGLDVINNDANEIDEPKTWIELLKESGKNLEQRSKLHKEGKIIGIPCPTKKLTKLMGGWINEDFIIIASRPGHGKTAWALECLKEAAKSGYNPCMFSLEMSDNSLVDRIIIGESGINANDYKSGAINQYDWNLFNTMVSRTEGYNILIDDKPKSINKIKAKIKTLHRKGKCDLAIIDYLQLCGDDSVKKNSIREQEISSISRKLKLLAKELKIPIIALSQLNRNVDSRPDKRPITSDLRESGAIEQDADIILFIYRPQKYGIFEDENGIPLDNKAYCIIDKFRGGEPGTIEFKYNESVTAIYDVDEDYTNSFMSNGNEVDNFEKQGAF